MTEPLMSVILGTDTWSRVDHVIRSLAQQTIAGRLELVIVASEADDVRMHATGLSGFHTIRVIGTHSITPQSAARALGVRESTAPFIFIAETHAFPDPGVLARLVEVLSGDWSVGVPGFRNSNPQNGLSWAAFLSDYGAWADNLPAGEIARTPSHDVAFRRSTLMEFGDRLEHALSFGDDLRLGLHARGHRAYFEPSAGLQHVNINRLRPWIRERFVCGVLIGGYRAERWGLMRRLVYACASPLIPFIVLARIQRGVRETGRRHRLPAGTYAAIVAGTILKAAGECRGYVLGAGKSAETAMTGFEVRKLAINAGDRS